MVGEETEGYAGNDLYKRKVFFSLEWKSEGVMDDESGESMEPMEEVHFLRFGESELERLVRGWQRETGMTEKGSAIWTKLPLIYTV